LLLLMGLGGVLSLSATRQGGGFDASSVCLARALVCHFDALVAKDLDVSERLVGRVRVRTFAV